MTTNPPCRPNELPTTQGDLPTANQRVWIVPKILHDEHVRVTPYVLPYGEIRRTSGVSTPDQAREYAARLLAAADEADRRAQNSEGTAG